MNTHVQTTRLDPEKHQDGVRCFLDYFALSPRRPGTRFLQEILERFAHLPYENLSKIISLNQSEDWNRPRLRLPETVIGEHIERRLGGTCFSLTFYLQTILTQCGFRCYPVMADMRAGRNLHCCLIVLLDGTKFLVDPGYLLTRPMEIHPEKPRLYRSEFAGIELRYEARTRRYHLSTFTKQESKWRYSFYDRPVPPEEFL
ncbi:MAG: hypothetical protein D6743_19585 [Calditrichaeota bacterium]|nr:MAG: hypothetical protein D6743_19585 [Calditrichota bacterium]